MSRLKKPQEPTPSSPKTYVTLLGDILLSKDWEIPDAVRIDSSPPKVDTGILQIQVEGKPINLSRSGLNIGIDRSLLEPIIDALEESGFIPDFAIIETGENDGSKPEHYSPGDYLLIQMKVVNSQYLSKCNPGLVVKYPSKSDQ